MLVHHVVFFVAMFSKSQFANLLVSEESMRANLQAIWVPS
jgi:hypothetical protein